jgi:peptide/nickel transport system substrate-binding protein
MTEKQRISIFLFILYTLTFTTLLGCGDKKTPGARQTLTIGIESNPISLDPRMAVDAVSSQIIQVVFNGLVKKDQNSRLVPDLAVSWEMPDERTYVFRLRENVLFHNGKEFSAKDVKYTYDSIRDPALKSPKRESLEKIESIEIIDPHTVKFHLSEPFAPFMVNMTIGIVPHEAVMEMGDEYSATHPLGTGPFKFNSWVQDQQVKLKSHTKHFSGPTRLKWLVFKVTPEDTVRVLELEKGSVQLIQNLVPPDLLPRLEKKETLKIIKKPGSTYAYMGFNLEDAILKKPAVRRAIAHAIDRDSIIEHILGSLARPARGMLSPDNWAYEKDVETYPYNPERSKQLLDQAGFPDPDKDGPAPRFSLVYKTSQNEQSRRVAEVIQQQLAGVGIGIDIKSYEWGTFFADIRSGNFQIYTLKWVGVTDPDIFYYTFHSSSIPPDGANRGRYKRAQVDRLLEAGRKTLDTKKRKDIYSAVQKFLARDLPYVNLWHQENVVAMKKNLKGFELYPAGDLYSLQQVFFDYGN